MKPEDNFNKENLIKGYKDIYESGGFGYVKKNEYGILDIVKGEGTLLDIGCGDGFWADILSEKFTVTGIDISPEGIEKAKQRRPDIKFIEGDFLEYEFAEKFDIVFARSPSFLNVPTLTREFIDGVLALTKVCRGSVWYIKWSQPPYDRYLEGSYIHDPEKIKKIFNTVIMKGNYFYANILV